MVSCGTWYASLSASNARNLATKSFGSGKSRMSMKDLGPGEYLEVQQQGAGTHEMSTVT